MISNTYYPREIILNHNEINLFEYTYDELTQIYTHTVLINDEYNEAIINNALSNFRINANSIHYSNKISYNKLILKMLFMFFFVHTIHSVGILTYIHETIGHLILGGNMITTPRNRYNLNYPSIYYQVDTFDNFRLMDKNFENYMKFLVGLYTDKLHNNSYDKNAGKAYPLLNLSNYTNIYYEWGYEQSTAFYHITGIIPNYILAVMLGFISIQISNYKNSLFWTYTLLISSFIYCVRLYSFLEDIYFTDTPNINHDILKWADYLAKYNNQEVTLIKNITMIHIISIYPLIMINLKLSNMIYNYDFISSTDAFKKIISDSLYNNILSDYICKIPKKKYKAWLKKYLGNTDYPICKNMQIHIYTYFFSKLDFLRQNEKGIFYISQRNNLKKIRLIRFAVCLLIIIVPWLNAYYYKNNTYFISYFLPGILLTLNIYEKFIIYHNKPLINTLTLNVKISTLLEIITNFYISYNTIMYSLQYTLTSVLSLFGDGYLLIILLLNTIDNIIVYYKLSKYDKSITE